MIPYLNQGDPLIMKTGGKKTFQVIFFLPHPGVYLKLTSALRLPSGRIFLPKIMQVTETCRPFNLPAGKNVWEVLLVTNLYKKKLKNIHLWFQNTCVKSC